MRISIMAGAAPGPESTLDGLVDRARELEARGFASLWLAQVFGLDAVSALAIAGRETRRIVLGTAVVPSYPRHPLALAQQALTAQAACGGRFRLGVGLSHRPVVEQLFGLSFEKPVRHMREYLEVLAPLLRGEPASWEGDVFRVRASLALPEVPRVPLLVAALGPAMLRVAGRLADGTITWMTGLRTLGEHIGPALRAAARAADRPPPQVVAGLPIALTHRPDELRARLDRSLQRYAALPSYRAMLDREGVTSPGEIALLGDEHQLRGALQALADAGVSELGAAVSNNETGRRTTEFLAGCL